MSSGLISIIFIRIWFSTNLNSKIVFAFFFEEFCPKSSHKFIDYILGFFRVFEDVELIYEFKNVI
jgi:hypothetical protein